LIVETIRHLLAGLIDYAGLFPPAGLAMAPAVRNFAAYRQGEHAWILGRFVVPAGRLEEFETAAADLLTPADPWPLSALVGNDPAHGAVIEAFHQRSTPARVSAVEATAASSEDIEAMVRAIPTGIEIFFEIDHRQDPAPLLDALAAARQHHGRVRAKIRTGGVTADAIPTAAEVARFLRACTVAQVPFKATAGLHHPLRGSYPLTYAPDAPQGTLFGFLNVFLAAALAPTLTGEELEALLQEESAAALGLTGDALTGDALTGDAITWRGHRLEGATLEESRRRFALSYGSCSFTEPIEDLQELSLL
jgi:hypothetical protein